MASEAIPSHEDPLNSELSVKLLQPTTGNGADGEAQQEWTAGETQPPSCRDIFFALLFLKHLGVILTLATMWGISDFGSIRLILFLGGGSVVLLALLLVVMVVWPAGLIQFSLVFNIFMTVAFMITCASQGYDLGFLASFLVFALGCCFAWGVWERIPFAACNLKTGLIAIRTNTGVVAFSILIAIAFGVYAVTWFLAVSGSLGHCSSGYTAPVLLVFLLVGVWTQQVLMNMVRVTVAGLVGTWWHSPEDASSVCSKSIFTSFARATTTSFGSICFGSLFVGVVQPVGQLFSHDLADNGPPASREGESATGMEHQWNMVVECFHRWAFIYIGLYGYRFMEAGRRVRSLFCYRRWVSTVMNDRFLVHVFIWMAFVVGAMNGFAGILLEKYCSLAVSNETTVWITFLVGFFVGMFLTVVMTSIIASAMDSVLVCFAEAPTPFENNHPALSDEMEKSWSATMPKEYTRRRIVVQEPAVV
eukprot:CAMPEP_0116829928 /NCGR_PEP_ID=MMETSP0418-20121206/4483_1 /TAXON_ID=1158023 /ORGANISM="Astrosyne radiata, Strain 13vi08-1A" /LENGTH=475 /DNA_ID=CAMNT_0004458981 /DNA_START=35 /DNA_END=1462 /DNA_ORIENTATION=-